MSAEKQLLILEDLGVPREDFEKLAKQANLPYNIVWEEEKANQEEVEALVTVKRDIREEEIKKYPNAKIIAVAFTGYDAVDLKIAHRNEIAVYNVPAYSTNSVTELAIGLTIGLLREIPSAQKTIRSGDWGLRPGLELSGKTVGILGTGTIGINTARVFRVLGCNLIGWSRSEKGSFKALGGRYISDKEDFFSQADIISIHLPHNEKTKEIVGEKELSVMKESAYLINTARGPIVDEKALIKVLKNKQIAGAGIDVYAQEPIDSDNELLNLDNTILTPHIAFKTKEALNRRAEVTINNLADFLNDDEGNRVDL